MKKALCFFLCLLLILSVFAGCEQEEKGNDSVNNDISDENSQQIADNISKDQSNVDESTIEVIDIVFPEDRLYDAALDNFYEDDEYIYQFGCLMSDAITVYYSDGTTQNVKEALADGNIVITDLNKYNITYTKIPKDVSN